MPFVFLKPNPESALTLLRKLHTDADLMTHATIWRI